MRLFVAVDVETAVLQRLAELQKTLRQMTGLTGREVKWVRPEQMHLTLKFLGAVADKDVPQVCAMVQETAHRYADFELTCQGVGVFGRPARVVWAGMKHSETLFSMQRELDERFTQAGWAAENRAYAAHLTVCRVKTASAGHVLAEAIGPMDQDLFGSFQVDSLVVYESCLSAAGPEYRLVNRSRLRGL